MRQTRIFLRGLAVLCLSVLCLGTGLVWGLEKQPAQAYAARRHALAEHLNGGVAVLFAAEEPQLDFMPYRQDEDFFYLTGWNEPGAALLIEAEANGHGYREILFLPERNRRMELYTGVKLDSAAPEAVSVTGVAEVKQLTELPQVLTALIAQDRLLAAKAYSQPDTSQAKALGGWVAASLGSSQPFTWHDVATLTWPLRVVKDEGELALLRKASDASIAAQRVMMKSAKPGVTERALAGKIIGTLMAEGCERPSYSPIVGSGLNSTVLHYSENSGTLQKGDLLVVDAAGEYSMYASDITRTVPVSGHFTARQKEVYDVVLGAQRAAIAAFVSGKSKINDREHKDPDSLDAAAWNYINTHGKDLHGETLGKYWIHGLGHMVGINVHDPADYRTTTLKPGMVFTIEPGVYIPEEKIGVRIEDVFVVGQDGKLVDLIGNLPHTTEEVEAAMKE